MTDKVSKRLDEGTVYVTGTIQDAVLAAWRIESVLAGASKVQGLVLAAVDAKPGTGEVQEGQFAGREGSWRFRMWSRTGRPRLRHAPPACAPRAARRRHARAAARAAVPVRSSAWFR